ncbi:MAG: ATP-grasp domain-containing protein [Eubacteriales bacterium]
MKAPSYDIVPVLLGADLNAYSMAQAFHRAYGVRSHAFGRYPLGVTQHSRLVVFHEVPELENPVICTQVLREFAASQSGKALFLFGCTDEYALYLIDERAALSDLYHIPCPSPAVAARLADKAAFYDTCRAYGVEIPRTALFSGVPEAAAVEAAQLGFAYPVVLKPSSSAAYWRHPFAGMQKRYLLHSPAAVLETAATIYGAGYDRYLLLQDFIPGGDADCRVLNTYVDREGHAVFLCYAQVLLEARTAKGRGNPTAVLTESPDPVCHQLVGMLEAMGYRGFANFDMKYDARDGKIKVFEVNLRQGRCHGFVNAAGINVARVAVHDCLQGEAPVTPGRTQPVFWHEVPRRVVRQHVSTAADRRRVRELCAKGRAVSPFFYRPDLSFNLPRLAYLTVHTRRQYQKYRGMGEE